MQHTPATNSQQAEALERLTRLQALTASLSEATTSEQVADAILTQAAAVLGASAGVVYRLSDDNTEFVCLRTTGYPEQATAPWLRLPANGRTPLSDAVRGREPVLLTNLAEREARYPEIARIPGVPTEGALAALPLVTRDKAIGGLGLRFPTEQTFTEQDRTFLLTIADLCAQALERGRLYDTERAARERAERAEEALRDSEQRHRLLSDLTSDFTFGLRFVEGGPPLLEWASESFTKFSGFTLQELNERGGWTTIVHPDDLPITFGAVRRVLAGQSDESEVRLVVKSGEVRWVRYMTHPVRDGGGRVTGFVGAAQDIHKQKRAAFALQESEERLRAIIDNCPSAIFVKDPEGHYLLANKACEVYSREPVERAIGKTASDYFPRELAEHLGADDRQVLETGNVLRYEAVMPAQDETLTALTVKFPLRDAGGRPYAVCGIATDITELKRATEALRANEERFTRFMQHLPGLAWIKDSQGRYLYANDAAVRAFRTPWKEFYGRTDEEVFPPATASQFRENDQKALASEAGVRVFETLEHEDGVLHYSLVSKFPIPGPDGAAALVGGMAFDITEEVRTREALDRERELLGTIIDRIPVMLTVYEPDTKVLRLNPAFEQATGWSGRDAAGISLMEQCYPDPAYRERVGEFMRSCRDGWMDIRMRTRGGCDLETSWANVRLSGGTQVGIGIDITDRKRYEDSLKEADRRKDEFLATLAHELRNPLAPLRNGLHLMKLAAGNAEAVEKARGMMERQLAQMVRLIDDLLDVSRITRGKLELRKGRVDLASVMQSAVEGSRPLIEESAHRLTVSLPHEPVHLDADPVRLAQVFANLLTNAAKYTDRGGHIRLTAERHGGEVVVTVKDTGIGIAPEDRPKLFEMFSQVTPALERSQGGLGIGLSLVKGLVEMHGGTVEAHSGGLGQGSEFVVRLPVLNEPPACQPPQSGGEKGPVHSKRRILVADDNRDTADSLAMMLRLAGHEVHTAYDGLEAVEAAAWFHPEVALLDIGMPRLNGYEACRRIREEPWGKGIVLVALSGWGQEEDKQRAKEAGFDQHLTKPVDPVALEKILAGFATLGDPQ